MWLLAKILAVITRHSRYFPQVGVDFEWSEKSWTHNVFRCFELIFGRKIGVRKEMSSFISHNCHWQTAHSFEAALALVETTIRLFLKNVTPIRLVVPILRTPEGFPFFASPYIFAIAFDATSLTTRGTPAASVSGTQTCTGSNLILIAGIQDDAQDTDTISTCTYNSVNLLFDNTNLHTAGSTTTEPGQGWIGWQFAPSTGANTFSLTMSSATGFPQASVASYSGAKQSSFPDSSNTATYQVAANATITTTVVAANCWGIFYYISRSSGITAGTNTTSRQITPQQMFGDTNATVSTGSLTMGATQASSTYSAIIVSFAPAVATTTVITSNLPFMHVG